jgi:hypothetical protein
LHSRELEVIDANGDLILVVPYTNESGERQTTGIFAAVFEPPRTPTIEGRFLVSSHILQLVSPVFQRMLASDFTEGIRFKACSESKEAAKLELPDDDCMGMRLFSRIAHHHPLSVADEEALTIWDIGAFALACDKYGCLDKFTFRSAAERWLMAPGRRKRADWSEGALMIAYILGDDEIFEIVTKQLILGSVDNFEKSGTLTTEFGPSTLPDGIISEFAISTWH